MFTFSVKLKLFAILWVTVMASGCPAPATQSRGTPTSGHSSSRFRFTNITDKSGVDAAYDNGRDAEFYAILESLGGGVGLFDLDKDGWVDMIFPAGGKLVKGEPPSLEGLPLQCFRNNGNLTWDDVSAQSSLGLPRRYTHGVAIADFNNDGFDDVLVTGYGGVDLWENFGDGTFAQVAEDSDLIDDSWSSSAGWGDLDGDGVLDLYLAHYVDWSFENNPVCPSPSPAFDQDVCPPRRFNDLDDRLFRSLGNGRFVDMSQAWGLVKGGKGLGVLLADFDNDSDTDLYVANDTVDNFLYVNDGKGNLSEEGLMTGCAVDFEGKTNGSMGLEFFDFDGDLYGDLWVTNFEHESAALYRNQGNGNFLHVSRDTGVTSVGELFVSFGTVARDFDRDSDLDIAVANGHVIYHPNQAPFAQKSIVLENLNNQNFRRVAFQDESFFSEFHVSRGVASDDFDNDGLADLVFTVLNGPAQILRNEVTPVGDRIRLTLIGSTANRNAIGARVVLHSPTRDTVEFIRGGGSYLSHSGYECDFHVANNSKNLSATIFWPGGEKQEINSLAAGENYFVIQNQSQILSN